MCVYIEKIKMILDHNTTESKHRMVMLIFVYLNAELLFDQLIGLLLFAEEPNINIAALTMFRPGITQTESISFNHHQRNPLCG